MELKDLLGGKGANLAEMTSVLGLPVPPGFTITTDACRAYMAGGWPGGPRRRGRRQRSPSSRRQMGKQLGDADDPLLVSVRSGRQVLDARDDGHRPQPRASTTSRSTGWPSRPATSASPTTPTAASCDVRPDRARHRRRASSSEPLEAAEGAGRRRRPTPTSPPATCASLCEPLQGHRAAKTGSAVPPGPDRRSSAAPIEAVFRSWNGARAIAYRVRERIRHDLGTAVNVQAMVFGNRDESSRHRRGLHPRPGHRRERRVRRLPINAQGEDVVAGIRNTEPLPP